MNALQESHSYVGVNIVFARDFSKTVKQHVHHDNISAERVNARGEDKIEWRRAREAVAPAKKAVCRYPGDKSK
jgi:hypothetical protein